MALIQIFNEYQDVTIANFSVVRIFKGPIYLASAGSTDDHVGTKVGNEFFAAAGSVLAFRGPGWIEVDAVTYPGLPSAFVTGNWTLTGAAGKATVAVSALPSLNGGAIRSIDYRVGTGPWVPSGRTTTGSFDIAPLPAGTASVRIRVRTDRGASSAGVVKTAAVT